MKVRKIYCTVEKFGGVFQFDKLAILSENRQTKRLPIQ